MGTQNRPYVDIMTMQKEVTGSLNLCIVKFPSRETLRFVVDCGLFQEKEYEESNRSLPFKPENIDFALVTHNHIDHIGRLPLMVKEGFRNKIYTSKETAKLMKPALEDSCKVLKEIYKRKNCKTIYYEEDVINTMQLVTPCPFKESISIGRYVRVTFLKNGHLFGAAMILVQISYPGEKDINLLFTGDYNNKNMFFHVPNVRKWVLDLPISIIQESTYGNTDSTTVEKTLKKNIVETVRNGGTPIIMVFSLGRAQEILYKLKEMQEDGSIGNIPIYFDGKLGIRYTELLRREDFGIREKMKDFIPDNLTYVSKETRMNIIRDVEQKIVVTTSGMGTYGPAPMYISEYINRENSLLQFTGYTAEGTLGRKLKDAEYGDMVNVDGVYALKRARVEYTTEFSAHAKADEMIAFLKQFKKLNLVLVNHGENDTKKIFAERIIKEVKPERVGILSREYFFRIGSEGLITTMGTKFN